MNLLASWLVATSFAGDVDAELLVARSHAAAEAGWGDVARAHAIAALARSPTPSAWEAYVRGSRAAGVWPLAREELAQLGQTDGAARVVWTVARVTDGEGPMDELRVAAEAVPDPGKRMLAEALWRDKRAPEALALAPDHPDDPAVARLRLAVLLAVGEGAEAAAWAVTWARRHPEHPEVLAELWRAPPAAGTATVRKRLLARLERGATTQPSPVWLYRADEVYQAAHATEPHELVVGRLAALGLEPPQGDDALAEARSRVEALLQAERSDDAVAVWVAARSARDTVEAALEHAWLLQLLDRPAEALPVALQARALAARPGPRDAAGLDTAAQAARLADAHGLIAELSLALAHPDTARRAVGVARALDPHPRWSVLEVLTQAVGSGAEDPGLPEDPLVSAVIDTLLYPTDGESWARRAALHESEGDRVAAFAAWTIAEVHDVEVGEAGLRTWDGPGHADAAAYGAIMAFHVARRAHREALAALRAADGGAVIEPVPVAPGVGLRLPAWEAMSLDGEPIRSADLAGRPYLLSLWASWCMPCLAELPALSRGAAELAAGGAPVTVVAISIDERLSLAQRLVADRGWAGLRFGWNPELGGKLGIDGLPTSLVVDGEGRVVDLSLGYDAQAVERMLRAAKPAP